MNLRNVGNMRRFMGFLTQVRKKIINGIDNSIILDFIEKRRHKFPPFKIVDEAVRYLEEGSDNPFYIIDKIRQQIENIYEDVEAGIMGKETKRNIEEAVEESFKKW